MEDSKMQLLDWLDDLCVRFIVNLPQEELASVERICFQVEEAQWFYEDFIRPLNPQLPSLSLKDFCLRMFQHCPLFAQFSHENHLAAFSEFLAYKTRVPVRGAIMLNDDMDKVLLVKGWKKSASWSFPRGKINKDEPDLDCAIREVYEETGFDIAAAGLVEDESKIKFIEVTMREQHIKLYVFRGVPTHTQFAPRTRKEISKIEWYDLASLPGYKKKKNAGQVQAHVANNSNNGEVLSASKLYIVAPFLVPLKKWIAQQKRHDAQRNSAYDSVASGFEVPPDDHVALTSLPTVDGAATMRTTGDANSHAPIVHLQAQAIGQDAAAELKRMLSIGGATVPPPPQAMPPTVNQTNPPRSNDAGGLLALLKSPTRPPAAHPQHSESVRPTVPPVDQYTFPTQQWPGHAAPQDPRHLQQQQQHLQQQPNLSGHQMGLLSQLQRPQPLSQQPQQWPPNQHSGFQQPVPPVSSQAQVPQGPPQQRPIVPSASQLPTPKLSSHAENLLSMFKTKPSPSAPAQPVSQAPSQNSQNLLNALTGKPNTSATSPASTSSAWNQPKRGSLGNLVPASIPPSRKASTTSTHLLKSTPPPQPLPAPLQSPWSDAAKAAPSDKNGPRHQDSLLSLFKPSASAARQDPPASLQPAIGSERRESPAGLPAELSAIASPELATDTLKKRQSPRVPAETAQPKVVSILQRPQRKQQQQQPETPTPAPQPVQANRSPGKQNQAQGQARAQSQNHTQSPARRNRHDKNNSPKATTLPRQQTPMQILRRPSDPSKQESSPPTSRSTVNSRVAQRPASRPSSRHGAAESLPKAQQQQQQTKAPFQPQILKRPAAQGSPEQSATASSPLAAPSGPISPTRSPPPASPDKSRLQREHLLSLFGQQPQGSASKSNGGGAQSPTATATPSGVISPAGAQGNTLASSLAGGKWPSTVQDAKAMPPPPPPPAAQTAADPPPPARTTPAMSRANSLAAPATPQTPISPSDRGFLLSYLDGAVKGAK